MVSMVPSGGAFFAALRRVFYRFMRRNVLVSAVLCLLAVNGFAQKNVRVEEDFDFDWKFTKVELPPLEMMEMPARPGGTPQGAQGAQSFWLLLASSSFRSFSRPNSHFF